jgi:exodeoxyribonuclease VII small subunit
LIDLITLQQYCSPTRTKYKIKMAAKKSFPFEESLSKLEELVERMENGDLSLEDSLKSFEEGIKLTRDCQKALKTAEQKVKLLIEQNGETVEKPFTPDVDEG